MYTGIYIRTCTHMMFMHTHACIHIHIVLTRIRTCTRMHTLIHTYTCTHRHAKRMCITCTHAHMHTCTHTFTDMHVYMHTLAKNNHIHVHNTYTYVHCVLYTCMYVHCTISKKNMSQSIYIAICKSAKLIILISRAQKCNSKNHNHSIIWTNVREE